MFKRTANHALIEKVTSYCMFIENEDSWISVVVLTKHYAVTTLHCIPESFRELGLSVSLWDSEGKHHAAHIHAMNKRSDYVVFKKIDGNFMRVPEITYPALLDKYMVVGYPFGKKKASFRAGHISSLSNGSRGFFYGDSGGLPGFSGGGAFYARDGALLGIARGSQWEGEETSQYGDVLEMVSTQCERKDIIFIHITNGKPLTQFLGVPFAEPPIGNLRFRKPKPKQPWRSVLDASKWPNSCIQALDYYFGEFYGATMWNANTPLSEDCLYLNVFVPGKIDPNKKLAVMVWVYGGGFWSGTSSLDVYDGRILSVEENVILVSMNYRVTILGFLYLGRPEAPGNVGLWDQQLALKWVHKNIDKFGGDPTRITLFGESAGAASVNMHMLSEKSTPYFHRAIIQSGSATSPWALESREVALARAVITYNAMKCGNMSLDQPDYDKILDCLLRADAEVLRENEWAPVREFADFPWVPVVDGDFLVENAATSLRQGNFKKTQLLIGSNHDEAIYFIIYQLPDIFPVNEFFTKKQFMTDRQTWLKAVYELLPRHMVKSHLGLPAILHEYEPAEFPASSFDWLDGMEKMLGDYLFTCSVNEMALASAKHGADTYYYYFTHRASAQVWPEWMGVVHGYEINLIFGEPYNSKFNYTAEEQELSSRFMRYWANFARTGDPNKNEDGTYTPDVWPKFNAQTMEYMNMTVESDYGKGAKRVGHGPRRKSCAFWKGYLPNLMTAVADVGDPFLLWKQQMDRWQNEYITDWQYHFEQYKKYQTYRHADIDTETCSND